MRKQLRNVSLALLAVLGVLAGLVLSPAPAQAATGKTNVYRLYNPNSGEHFYTTSQDEAIAVAGAGWNWEGIAFADSLSASDGDPVFRVYNPSPGGRHHYTRSAKERDWLVSLGWRDEGIEWYELGTAPLYRVYNPNSGEHLYTLSAYEANYLDKIGWNLESNDAWKVSSDVIPIKPFWLKMPSAGGDGMCYVDASGQITKRPSVESRYGSDYGSLVASVAVAVVGSDGDGIINTTGDVYGKVNDPRLSKWYSLADSTLGAFGGNCAYSSCAQATAAVLAATVDPDIGGANGGSNGVSSMQNWFRTHPAIYQRIPTGTTLQPGDVFAVCTDSVQSINIWVGTDAAQKRFPGTSSNFFEAVYHEGKYPFLARAGTTAPVDFEVYRIVGKAQNPHYPYIDLSPYLN